MACIVVSPHGLKARFYNCRFWSRALFSGRPLWEAAKLVWQEAHSIDTAFQMQLAYVSFAGFVWQELLRGGGVEFCRCVAWSWLVGKQIGHLAVLCTHSMDTEVAGRFYHLQHYEHRATEEHSRNASRLNESLGWLNLLWKDKLIFLINEALPFCPPL